MPPSLHRVLSGQFPGFTSTAGHSDCLPPIPPRFVAFAWRYRSLRSCFAPVGGRAQPPQARGFFYPAVPRAGHRAETAGPPRFLGNPTVHMPCSSTPVGPPRQAFSALRCCLPPLLRRRLPRQTPFGAPSHGLRTRCLRFASSGYPAAAQDSLPAAGQLCRAGLATRWVPHRVSERLTSHPPCPGLAWRTIIRARAGSPRAALVTLWPSRPARLR